MVRTPLKAAALLLAALLLHLVLAATARAQGATFEDMFDPNPDPKDIALPMPHGLKAVFHPVGVPGTDFWDADRQFQLGDPSGQAIFETLSNYEVGGTFQDLRSRQWMLPFGKYEITRAQFIAVMSCERDYSAKHVEVRCGDLQSGADRVAALTGDAKLKADLKKIDFSGGFGSLGRGDYMRLAKPVSWVPPLAISEFIETYSLWCLQTKDCLAKMPKADAGSGKTIPGYFRLPTEIEWEYTLRSHNPAGFNSDLPVESATLSDYAWINDPMSGKTITDSTRIGRFKPLNGVYDMIGNVDELVYGPFQPRIGGGKVGGYAVRGGSYFDSKALVARSSFRAEASRYQFHEGDLVYDPAPLSKTGFRMVIGGDVIVSQSYRDDIERSYEKYREEFRKKGTVSSLTVASAAPAPRPSRPSTAASSGDPLTQILALSKTGADKEDYRRIEAQVDAVRKTLADNNRELAARFTALAYKASWAYGTDYFQDLSQQKVITKMSSSPSPRMQETIAELKRKLERNEKHRAQQLDDYVDYLRWLSDFGDQAIAAAEDYPIATSDALGQQIKTMLVGHIENAVRGSFPKRAIEADFKELYSKSDFK